MTIKGNMKTRKSNIILSPGDVVRELRTKKGWTQSELSSVTGIAVPNISNVERNRSQLGEERAIILAEAFEVKPEIILFPNGFKRADLQPKLRSIRKRLKSLIKKKVA